MVSWVSWNLDLVLVSLSFFYLYFYVRSTHFVEQERLWFLGIENTFVVALFYPVLFQGLFLRLVLESTSCYTPGSPKLRELGGDHSSPE